MTRGQAAAAEALTWVGTPFLWQQSVKGKGCDCKMLVAGVARECGFPEASSAYALMGDYSDRQRVPSALLRQGLDELFDRIEFDTAAARKAIVPPEIKPGDVLLLNMAKAPNHLAIAVSETTSVHAKLGSSDKVVETSTAVLLRKYRLVALYRWKVI